MSKEYSALMALQRPTEHKAGDMWVCDRLGIVKVFTAHKRGTRRGQWPTNFHLYHWGKPSMYSHPADWRNNNSNASIFDPDSPREEKWRYLGNIFQWLPYHFLTGRLYESWSSDPASP